jgi:hypothetical protein
MMREVEGQLQVRATHKFRRNTQRRTQAKDSDKYKQNISTVRGKFNMIGLQMYGMEWR